ncbi:MAG: helix-turn-helix domain-containing protein [Lachnospiraceae bacterium]|nr:helix-turn-helix domain-containing protein [Lachnospiraceae bacterium]
MRSGQPAVWRIDTYRDIREAQAIAKLSGSETVQCITEEIVGPLRAHDAASGMDLLDTPVTVIKCNCNISLTARTLYIHRTSLLYQLEKSESVTGMSLKDP